MQKSDSALVPKALATLMGQILHYVWNHLYASIEANARTCMSVHQAVSSLFNPGGHLAPVFDQRNSGMSAFEEWDGRLLAITLRTLRYAWVKPAETESGRLGNDGQSRTGYGGETLSEL